MTSILNLLKACLELDSPQLCATSCTIFPVILLHLILYFLLIRSYSHCLTCYLLYSKWNLNPARWGITFHRRIKKHTSRKLLHSRVEPIIIVHILIAIQLPALVYRIVDDYCLQFHYWSWMMIPIRRLPIMTLRIPESPPCHLTIMKTFWIINRRFFIQARCTGARHYELYRFHCQSNIAVPILSLHALHSQIPEIQLWQLCHFCSNTERQPSSPNYLSHTMHHPPRRCHYLCLVQTWMLHNPRPVEICIFPNSKWQHLRKWNVWWRQSYWWRLLGQYYPMTSTGWLKKLRK